MRGDARFLFELRVLTANTEPGSRGQNQLIFDLYDFKTTHFSVSRMSILNKRHYEEFKYEVVFMDDLHFLRHEIFE